MSDPYNTAKSRRDPWKDVPVKKDRRIVRIENPIMRLRKPRLGDTVNVFGGRTARVVKLHGMGTVDAETSDGKRYRVTGLPIMDIDIPSSRRKKNPIDIMTALNAAGDIAMMKEFSDEKAAGAFVKKRRKNPYGQGKCPPHLKKFRFKKMR